MLPIILHTHNISYNGDVVRVMPQCIAYYMSAYKDGRKQTIIQLSDGYKIWVTETPDEIDQKLYQ